MAKDFYHIKLAVSMTNKLQKRNAGSPKPKKIRVPSEKKIEEFKLHLLNEVHAQVMIIIFLASAFTTVVYFNQTLISVIGASKLFAIIGLAGFFSSYLLRNKLGLSLLDGLFYNAFGLAPIGLALTLFLNAQCNDTYTETYRIKKHERGGSGFTYILENDVYSEFWHIRNLSYDEVSGRGGNLELTLCDGLFGMKVVKKRALVR